jgi:phosphoserine phosphatase
MSGRKFAVFDIDGTLIRWQLYHNILSEITYEQFEKAAQAVFDEYKDQVYTYTRDLLGRLKKEGYLLFAISGSQKEIVAKMAKYYGFDDFASRVDEHKDNHFTGDSTTPIFSKDKVLNKMAKKHGAEFAGSLGVGDSTTDIKMLDLVEKPIAFNPERGLFDYAKDKGWQIVIERKNMIYELEFKDGKYQLASAG